MRFDLDLDSFTILRREPGKRDIPIGVINVGYPQYAETVIDALNREWGTPEPATIDEVSGIEIPDGLRDRAHLIASGLGKDPLKRSVQEVDAIADFIRYCDANNIKLPSGRTQE